MKTFATIFALLVFFVFTACQSNEPIAPQEDYKVRETEIVDSTVNSLLGIWAIRTVNINFEWGWSLSEVGITKDTILKDLASMEIYALTYRTSPVQRNNPTMLATLVFGKQRIPVSFNLSATGDRVAHRKGPHCVAFIQPNFPEGIRYTSPEEDFLNELGFFDNFYVELTKKDESVWTGLNRPIGEMKLVKTANFAPFSGK